MLEHLWELRRNYRIDRRERFLATRAIDLSVRIEQRQSERVSEINRNETDRKESGVHLLSALRVFVNKLCRIAGSDATIGVDFMLADRGEAVIGSQKNICVRRELRIALNVVQDLFQIVVRILQRRFGSWPIYAGN